MTPPKTKEQQPKDLPKERCHEFPETKSTFLDRYGVCLQLYQRGNCASRNTAAESESQRVANDRSYGRHYYLQSSRR